MLRLLHNQKEIGTITGAHLEGVWMQGFLHSPELDPVYRAFFDYMTDEDNGFDQDPPFDEILLEDENWFVVEDGVKRPISMPAVHKDSSIEWRWR